MRFDICWKDLLPGSRPFVAIALAVLVPVPVWSAIPAPTGACSALKSTAVAKAFVCHVKKKNPELRIPRPGSSSVCDAKLAHAFANAEARTLCSVVGDTAVATALAAAVADKIFDLVGGDLAVTTREKVCAVAMNLAAGRFALCRSRITKDLMRREVGVSGDADFVICFEHYDRSMGLASEDESCLFDLYAGRNPMPALVGPVSAYLPGADLAGRKMNRRDYLWEAVLTGADLSGSNMDFVPFGAADLSGANLDGATLEAAWFDGANLGGVELAGNNLAGVEAVHLVACPASLPPSWECRGNALAGPYVSMYYENLAGIDWSGMDLNHAYLSQVNLDGADISGANLAYASLGCTFNGANLSGTDLTRTALYGAQLNNANLAGADLTDAAADRAELVDADLTGAKLNGTDFVSADLSLADLTQADLSGADLSYAHLDSMIWANTICPDLSNSDANGMTCCGHHVGVPPSSCSP